MTTSGDHKLACDTEADRNTIHLCLLSHLLMHVRNANHALPWRTMNACTLTLLLHYTGCQEHARSTPCGAFHHAREFEPPALPRPALTANPLTLGRLRLPCTTPQHRVHRLTWLLTMPTSGQPWCWP